jgi:hypothetical protein
MIKTRPVESDTIPVDKYEKIAIAKRLLLWLCDAGSRAVDGDDDSIVAFETELRKMLDTLDFPNYAMSIQVYYLNEVTVVVNTAFQLEHGVNAWVNWSTMFNIH